MVMNERTGYAVVERKNGDILLMESNRLNIFGSKFVAENFVDSRGKSRFLIKKVTIRESE
jgi:hypothetical protein